MALIKAIQVSDVPNLHQITENTNSLSLCPSLLSKAGGKDDNDCGSERSGRTHYPCGLPKKFVVMGHRGSGMNILQSSDARVKAIKENSLRGFNAASSFNLDYIEFDVQVTKDGYPVIFHDIFILTKEEDRIIEKRVTELTLDEFLSFGPQRKTQKVGKPVFRKTNDGRIFEWKVEEDDHLCTLEEVFQNVNHSLGFNIEFKFNDHMVYSEEKLVHIIQLVLQVVHTHAKDRPIMFSSFQPDAALLIRKLQKTFPVFFLTRGGAEIYPDVRRNSLEEAIKLCMVGGLQGIVSEVKAVLRNPEAITKIKECKLSIITYGQLNNVAEIVYTEYLMGVEGVIVDLVQEITEAASEFSKATEEGEKSKWFKADGIVADRKTPFSDHEISFFFKLTPECNELQSSPPDFKR